MDNWPGETSYRDRAFSRRVERMSLDGDGIYVVDPCKPGLCCQVNPHLTCCTCNNKLCKECIDKLYGVVPPWSSENEFCGTWVL